MWNPQVDPLGLNLQQKVRDRRFQAAVNGLQSPIGPLPDPKWDAFFEAADEAGNGKPVKFGSDAGSEQSDVTADPQWASSVARNMPMAIDGMWNSPVHIGSQQLGTPIPRRLKKA